MNKIFNKFLIGLLFLLGVMLIPTYKADATVTVNVSANPPTVNYNGNSTITWSSSAGVTSCSISRTDNKPTVTGLAPSGTYPTGNLTVTTTFTVTCTKPAYCSGLTNVSRCYGTAVGGDYNGKSCQYYFADTEIYSGNGQAPSSEIQSACGPNLDHTGCTYIPSITFPCSNFTGPTSPGDPGFTHAINGSYLCDHYPGCTWIP